MYIIDMRRVIANYFKAKKGALETSLYLLGIIPAILLSLLVEQPPPDGVGGGGAIARVPALWHGMCAFLFYCVWILSLAFIDQKIINKKK